MKHRSDDFLRSPFRESDDAAEVDAAPDALENLESALLIQVGLSFYAFQSAVVLAICPERQIFTIPFIANRFCLGFVSHNGIAVPVTDISLLLGKGESPDLGRPRRLIILKSDGFLTGFFADEVIGVRGISKVFGGTRIVERLTITDVVIDAMPAALLSSSEITRALEEGRR